MVTLLGALLVLAWAPAAPAEEASSPSPFSFYDVTAEAQGGANYFYAIGEEVNRFGSARVEAETSNVNSIAALFHRGLVAGYTYGATLGKGGAGGTGLAPDPPPGEIQGRYPAEPNEVSWQGPITTAANGAVIDGKEHVKSIETGGLADIVLQAIDVPGQLTVRGGTLSSKGGLMAAGVEADSVSVLYGVTIGGVVQIEELTSKAHGLIAPGSDKPTGEGSTVAEGVTINGTPVRITGTGLEAAGQGQGGQQKGQLSDNVRKALAAANIEDIRLAETTLIPGSDGQSMIVRSGGLRVIYRNNTVRDATPQAIAGGGFEVGGAAISVAAKPPTQAQ